MSNSQPAPVFSSSTVVTVVSLSSVITAVLLYLFRVSQHASASDRGVLLPHNDLSRLSGTSGRLFEGKKIRDYLDAIHFADLSPAELSAMPRGALSLDAGVGNSSLRCDRWAVVTTINPPTPATTKQAFLPRWCLVVVGDKKGPMTYDIVDDSGRPPERMVFLDVDAQLRLAAHSKLLPLLRWNHFGRKNAGYLFAIAHGAQMVYDFDDDNLLLPGISLPYLTDPSPQEPLQVQDVGFKSTGSGAGDQPLTVNPYPLMGGPASHSCWPRGFPLDLIKSAVAPELQVLSMEWKEVGVVQFLANGDPDVDAIYRLTQPLPFDFPVDRRPPIAIRQSPLHLTPYNAQTTLHFYHALWTMLLPITVHGRVSDIYRSYFAQRLMKETNSRLLFHSPSVRQDRNDHSYLADFNSELPLYERAGKLVSQLSSWQSTAKTLPGQMEDLYIFLYEHGYIEMEDVKLLQAWIFDLLAAGYLFPDII